MIRKGLNEWLYRKVVDELGGTLDGLLFPALLGL